MAAFKHLVRFSRGGDTYYGDLVDFKNGVYTVKRLRGNDRENLEPTNEVIETEKVRKRKPLSTNYD